jgi:hypothetical protein
MPRIGDLELETGHTNHMDALESISDIKGAITIDILDDLLLSRISMGTS